jgi:hypothetical protein
VVLKRKFAKLGVITEYGLKILILGKFKAKFETVDGKEWGGLVSFLWWKKIYVKNIVPQSFYYNRKVFLSSVVDPIWYWW